MSLSDRGVISLEVREDKGSEVRMAKDLGGRGVVGSGGSEGLVFVGPEGRK